MTDRTQSRWPLGVFTSIDAGLGVHLEVAHQLGIPTIQLHAPSVAYRTAQHATDFIRRLEQLGIQLTAVFGGFQGESYADIPTTRETVGLVPARTRASRLAEMREIADFTRVLGCDVVGLHLGFIPDPSAVEFEPVVAVTRELCDHCAAISQHVHLETGQETAAGLLAFMRAVQRPNLFVNFDPANMILYGTGNPIEALREIGTLVRSVHCKDARWAASPGQEWGTEVRLGEGDVDIELYLKTLRQLGYDGPLTIEREIPHDPARQQAEISHAASLLTHMRAGLLDT